MEEDYIVLGSGKLYMHNGFDERLNVLLNIKSGCSLEFIRRSIGFLTHRHLIIHTGISDKILEIDYNQYRSVRFIHNDGKLSIDIKFNKIEIKKNNFEYVIVCEYINDDDIVIKGII